MDDVDAEGESEPIATATRVPPETFESADESDDGSDNKSDDESNDDEYPPVLTATRVS